MANNAKYRFSRGDEEYIAFDSNGYIVEAKGFGGLIWSTSINLDKELIGKHVDELAEMLKKMGVSTNEYLKFEETVRVPLLKEMLQNANH